MTEHHLKTDPIFWEAIRDGRKPFEVRLDDRDFRVDDTLILHRSATGSFEQARALRARVTYKLPGGQFGIEMGYCVLGIAVEWTAPK